MSDALPRNITLIGRLEKEHAADSPRRLLEILHESITKKPPLSEASSSIGAAYRIPRIRFARLPARSPARYGRSASASRSRLDRGSNPCSVYVKEKPPLPGALISNGAAYRIRTYDVLIRSQTLYPAEVTPQLVDYYAQGLNNGQVFFQKKFLKLSFTHLATWRDLRCIAI